MIDRENIVIKNELEEINVLTEKLHAFCVKHHILENFEHDINLAVEEIVVNAITYGYSDEEKHNIVIKLKTVNSEICIIVEDDGNPFDPLTVESPDVHKKLEDRELGGYGIHFVKNIMDNLSYRRKDNKNILSMTKKIQK
ncbi:MAG: ATP-binding protein [Candidatus Ancaeobacter aquaticus]|nr:ATP-binding protein [Candidatus Ancaeobacter aquaticus]